MPMSRARLSPMNFAWRSDGVVGQVVDVGHRIRQPLRMGKVGAEQHVAVAQQLGQQAVVPPPRTG